MKSACGVLIGCAQFGFWQSAVVSVFTYTPPSDEKILGQRSVAWLMSNAMSPASSCAPTVVVNGPNQPAPPLPLPVVGQRVPGPPLVHSATQRLMSPNQRSNTLLPAALLLRWFVASSASRPTEVGLASCFLVASGAV